MASRIVMCSVWLFALACQTAAIAGPKGDALTKCMSTSLSQDERRTIYLWTFITMASHPDLRPLVPEFERTKNDAAKSMGALVTRLISQACARQARDAKSSEGPMTIATSIASLGLVGSEEVFAHPAVQNTAEEPAKYLDSARINAAVPR